MKDGDYYKFVVSGIPRGFVAVNWKGFVPDSVKKRVADYKDFRDRVVVAARQARLCTPVEADSQYIVHVETTAYFKNGVHSDPENVHKGLVDSLFYGTNGLGDKWTGGWFAAPLYDREKPRVEVTIECFSPGRYKKEVLDA